MSYSDKEFGERNAFPDSGFFHPHMGQYGTGEVQTTGMFLDNGGLTIKQMAELHLVCAVLASGQEHESRSEVLAIAEAFADALIAKWNVKRGT